jgi:hypothetical protein
LLFPAVLHCLHRLVAPHSIISLVVPPQPHHCWFTYPAWLLVGLLCLACWLACCVWLAGWLVVSGLLVG